MAKVSAVKRNVEIATIELGGRVRELRFDMNAFAELENRFGTIDAAMDALSSGQMGQVKIVLWAGLIHDEVEAFDEVTGEPIAYNITPYQVGGWVENPSMLTEVAQLVGKAMSFSMPNPEDLPDDIKAKLKEKGIDLQDFKEKAPTKAKATATKNA